MPPLSSKVDERAYLNTTLRFSLLLQSESLTHRANVNPTATLTEHALLSQRVTDAKNPPSPCRLRPKNRDSTCAHVVNALKCRCRDIIQNIWKKLWRYALVHRREVKARSQQVQTAWYREKLAVLAQTLWKQRDLLFTSDERMSPEEQQQLVEIMETAPKGRKLRTFLHGVWHIFRDSRDAQDAREALEALKRVKIEPKAHSAIQKVLAFLEDPFEQMMTSLTHADVQRNSLAESGMRVLRRLEVGHDGLRTPKGRENCVRIYQAVKYLGWSVHNPPTILVSVPWETLQGQESGVTLSPVGKGPPYGPCHSISTVVG